MIGRQRLSAVRPWLTVCLMPALALLLMLGSSARSAAVAALVAGILAGTVLGRFGLRHTRFEHTAEGFCYTPNAHIGIALSLLLGVRLLFRFGQLYAAGGAAVTAQPDFARSPITLAIFGTLVGYYVTYAIGLLLWRRRAGSAPGVPLAPQPQERS